MAITPPDSRVRMFSPAELLAYLDRDEDQGSGLGLGSLLQLASFFGRGIPEAPGEFQLPDGLDPVGPSVVIPPIDIGIDPTMTTPPGYPIPGSSIEDRGEELRNRLRQRRMFMPSVRR